MSFQNSTFSEGSSLAATGGTTKTLKSLGSTVTSNALYVDEDTDPVTRRHVDVSTRPAKQNSAAPGGYTQEWSKIAAVQPKVLANGNKTNNTVSLTASFDPETTVAERTELVEMVCQLAFGSASADLFSKGNPQ